MKEPVLPQTCRPAWPWAPLHWPVGHVGQVLARDKVRTECRTAWHARCTRSQPPVHSARTSASLKATGPSASSSTDRDPPCPTAPPPAKEKGNQAPGAAPTRTQSRCCRPGREWQAALDCASRDAQSRKPGRAANSTRYGAADHPTCLPGGSQGGKPCQKAFPPSCTPVPESPQVSGVLRTLCAWPAQGSSRPFFLPPPRPPRP